MMQPWEETGLHVISELKRLSGCQERVEHKLDVLIDGISKTELKHRRDLSNIDVKYTSKVTKLETKQLFLFGIASLIPPAITFLATYYASK